VQPRKFRSRWQFWVISTHASGKRWKLKRDDSNICHLPDCFLNGFMCRVLSSAFSIQVSKYLSICMTISVYLPLTSVTLCGCQPYNALKLLNKSEIILTGISLLPLCRSTITSLWVGVFSKQKTRVKFVVKSQSPPGGSGRFRVIRLVCLAFCFNYLSSLWPKSFVFVCEGNNKISFAYTSLESRII